MRVFVYALALSLVLALGTCGNAGALTPDGRTAASSIVLQSWYKLILDLVRHTPTYSPPVASRSFAYLGVAAFESMASGKTQLQSLAGQLHDLQKVPPREAGKAYDEAVVLQATLSASAQNFFSNTGPTGQRALAAQDSLMLKQVSAGVPAEVVKRSLAYGKAVAAHIQAWSLNDGGAIVENMGFPMEYKLRPGLSQWVPTSLIIQQQKPLLPDWGNNRTFAVPSGAECKMPLPLEYSEDKTSEFYKQALEVVQMKQNLTPEQRAIALFWADDPMLSATPPGHWIAIALHIFEKDKVEFSKSLETLARIGITEADAFIGCWNKKYDYNTLRPVTYIRRVIDPKWEPLIITPPFPEYPSGHSVQSAASATVLAALYGDHYAFDDTSHMPDGLAARSYPSFWAAAEEAGLSRMYGGIHFRAGNERGLDLGRCIGGFASALKMRK